MIGRGIAFSNDWTMDDTYSLLVHGPLDGAAEKEMFDAGAEARKTLKRRRYLDLAQCSEV